MLYEKQIVIINRLKDNTDYHIGESSDNMSRNTKIDRKIKKHENLTKMFRQISNIVHLFLINIVKISKEFIDGKLTS